MKHFCLILTFLIIFPKLVISAEIGSEPTLRIATLDGKNFDLKEKRGKVVIINFWAKWCINCRKEMLILDEIYREYKSHNVEVIGINIGSKKERRKITEASSSLSYPNAMLIDVGETSFEEPNQIPLNYIIDKNGKLIAKINANDETKLTKQEFENLLKPLLK